MSGGISDYRDIQLSGNIKRDTEFFRNIFKHDDIIRMRTINRAEEGLECTLIYIDGMVNIEILNDSIVRPLMVADLNNLPSTDTRLLAGKILFAADLKITSKVEDMLRDVLYGDTLLIIDGSADAMTINTKGWRTRGISEPDDERVLQGPREGFDEAAMLNLAMIRRKLLTPDLCIEMQRVGRRTDTGVYICYLESLANPNMVTCLKNRISEIDIDGILDSNYIAEHIRDHKGSLLKTTGSTERPDIVAARLLEGRIAIVVDGTPVVLTVPYLFSENFQSDEDYYLNFMVSSVGRILRYICFFAALSVPAIFVALTTFHIKLLPTSFALSIAQLRGGVPMSSVVECIILIIVFEVLKEAGVRMPQSLGHALSIVGGLVIGQAAVEARIISAPMLIAVALSGISGLMIPHLKGIVFYMRLVLVLASAMLGLFGYMSVGTIIIIRILSMKSFGVDYTASLKNPNFQSLKDTFWRAPWPFMIKRPSFNRNIIRSRDLKNDPKKNI